MLRLFALANIPVPRVDHCPLPVVDVPVIEETGLLRQAILFGPAFTFGGSVIVIIIVSVTEIQVPFPVVVRIIVTLPAVVSAALGV